MMLYVFIFLALLMLFIGWLAGRKQTEEGFSMYDRKLPAWLYGISYAATQMGAGFFIAGAGYAYLYGKQFLWILVGLVIGVIVFAAYSRWLRSQKKAEKLYTLPDYYRSVYGRKAELFISWICFVALAADLSIQFVGGGKLLSVLGVAPAVASIVLTAVVIGIYLYFSGFRAVVWTDVVLIVLMFVLSVGIAYAAITRFSTTALTFVAAPISTAIGFFLYGLLAPFASSHYYQRIFAGKDAKSSKLGTWLSFLWVLVPAIALLFIGAAARSINPSMDPDLAFTTVLGQVGLFTLYAGSVLLWAALMSTADTMAFTSSQILTHNIRGKQMNRRNVRLSLLIVLLIAAGISLAIPSVTGITLLTLAMTMMFAVPNLAQWFVQLREKTIVLVFAISVCGTFLYVLLHGLDPSIVVVTVSLSTLSMLLLGLWEKRGWVKQLFEAL